MAYENGRKVLNFNQCKKIANLYHIGVDEVFKNSEKVTLYDVSKTKTDELNIEYFLPPKTFKDHSREFVEKHSILLGVMFGVIILGIIVISVFGSGGNTGLVDVIKLDDINRLAVSNTTAVYIDELGSVRGSGDNANGQISNLPSRNAVKVAEGSTYTVILNNDGTVDSKGLTDTLAEGLAELKDIIDIASGDNHIVAVDIKGRVYAFGDNKYGQCEVDDYRKISKVYATKNGTILLGYNGDLYCRGEFIGSGQLKNYNGILDLDTSNDNLVLLTKDGTVDYIAKTANFLNIYKWRDIVDVACGDNFIAALNSEGKVYIDTADILMKKTVAEWNNIIAIASGDEYLLAYDGENIYGTGKNDYHQFESAGIESVKLAQVSGVKVTVSSTIDVSFDKVINAQGYEIVLNVGEGNTYRVSSNQTVSFYVDEMEDDKTYQITITTLGDGIEYLDSLPLVVDFAYHREEIVSDDYVEIDRDFETMTIGEFEAYLRSIGVNNMVGIEQPVECVGDNTMIISVDGISKGQKISRNDLSKAVVTYNYCRIREREPDAGNE